MPVLHRSNANTTRHKEICDAVRLRARWEIEAASDMWVLWVPVLIGPEGGFAEDERAALLRAPNLVRLALGPRIVVLSAVAGHFR